tara:strand:- start:340 stop:717 length:378 start_codon:yes stop_codon:yes gene_type:complete
MAAYDFNKSLYSGGTGNEFADFLSDPSSAQHAYYSSRSGADFAGQSPASQRYFERSFGDIYNQYLGKLHTQTRDYTEGKRKDKPSLSWMEYLSKDPFTERYTALPPSAKGTFSGAYSPTTRRIFF